MSADREPLTADTEDLRRAGDQLAAALVNALAYVTNERTARQGWDALAGWPHPSLAYLRPDLRRPPDNPIEPATTWEILKEPFMRGWALGSLIGGAGGVVVFTVSHRWLLASIAAAIVVMAAAAIRQIGWRPAP